MTITLRSAALILGLALAGCAAGPTFGDSVRHMVEGQKHDPAAPRAQVPAGVDGVTAAKAVDAYHSSQRPAPKAPTPTILLPSTP